MKLGKTYNKMLGALAAVWLSVFCISGVSAAPLNGASSDTVVKFNYFANRSSWMSPAMSPGGSMDAIRLGALSLPGVVTGWADYVTWGENNKRWSGVAEHIIAYNSIMDANVKLLRRIIQENPDLLLKNSRVEGITNDHGVATSANNNIPNKPFAMIKSTKKEDPKPTKLVDTIGKKPPEYDLPPPASGS